ncbi:MAG: hypothetical protein KAJ24_03320 [Candidatus Aenigmarchaeota archaeon]|nr:hypothetical protein [Candidatus Aenigmarchaeota archaeon]
MNKPSIFVIAMIACMFFAAMPAAAEVIVNEKVDYQSWVYIPCENDWVHLNGTLHVIQKITLDKNGGRHVSIHYNPQEVTGESLRTDNQYNTSGVTRWKCNFVAENVVYDWINRFNIERIGDDFVYTVHETTHSTWVDGEMKSWISKREVTCG